jgi:hypothetical protein
MDIISFLPFSQHVNRITRIFLTVKYIDHRKDAGSLSALLLEIRKKHSKQENTKRTEFIFKCYRKRFAKTSKTEVKVKVKVIPQRTEVVQGVPGSLRPGIFLTFGTTRVIRLQPYAPAAFTPVEIPGTHFQRPSRPQGTWFRREEPRKKSPVTPPGIVTVIV